MGGTTRICTKCKIMFRVSSDEEDEYYKEEHRKECDGKIESIWKNIDKMDKKERENIEKQILWKHGELGKYDKAI